MDVKNSDADVANAMNVAPATSCDEQGMFAFVRARATHRCQVEVTADALQSRGEVVVADDFDRRERVENQGDIYNDAAASPLLVGEERRGKLVDGRWFTFVRRRARRAPFAGRRVI